MRATLQLTVMRPAVIEPRWQVRVGGRVTTFDNSPKGRADLEDHVLELLGTLQRGVLAAELPEYPPITEPRCAGCGDLAGSLAGPLRQASQPGEWWHGPCWILQEDRSSDGGHPEYGGSDGPG